MRRKTSRRTSRRTSSRSPKVHVSKYLRAEIWGILLVAIALITLLSIFSANQGDLTRSWLTLLRRGFGWGMYLIPIGLGGLGVWLFLRGVGQEPTVAWERITGLLIVVLSILPLIHILHLSDDAAALAEEGGGGGYFGWYAQRLLVGALGTAGAVIILLATMLAGFFLFSDISWERIQRILRIRAVLSGWHLSDVIGRLRRPRREVPGAASSTLTGGTRSKRPPEPEARSAPARTQTGRTTGRIIGDVEEEIRKQQPAQTAIEWKLPSLDILEDIGEVELSASEIRSKALLIEETLQSFGVPVRVVEVNQGPLITQFCLEPGYTETRQSSGRVKQSKVKVSKISSLADDLALALSAAPVRIEAPIPGRSLVGIEVPNSQVSLVSLKGVMDSEDFRGIDSRLAIAMGQDVSGTPVVADLASMPHLLIAGATGSGKSVCINSLIVCMLFRNTPNDLKLILIDPKRVELTMYGGIPHLLGNVIVEIPEVVNILKGVTREMDRRYRVFAKLGARNIEGHNRLAEARGETKLPYIVVFIDELADLMMVAPEDVERSVCRIAQMARATGIHLVMATQRPSVNVVTGLIKANFPARLSFAVTSQIDSRVILDAPGAEKLLGRGDSLFLPPDSSALVRLRGCYLSDAELKRVVHHWKALTEITSRGGVPLSSPQEIVQRPLWEDEVLAPEEERGGDSLYDKAVDLVREQGRASVSLLQRRLSIGYNRAARMIDRMEEEEIVGPYGGQGVPRKVLVAGEEEPLHGDDVSSGTSRVRRDGHR